MRPMREAETSSPSVSGFYRQCGIFNISQSYRPPRSLKVIALLFYMYMMFVPHRKHMSPQPVNGDSFTVLYVDDVRTSQEAHASTAC
jgi:hypothetical protein